MKWSPLSVRALHPVHEAYLIALVFFQDTYTIRDIDGYLGYFCKQAWSVMYTTICTPNETHVFDKLNWSVASVFPVEPLLASLHLSKEQEELLDNQDQDAEDEDEFVELEHDALREFLHPKEHATIRSMQQAHTIALGRWVRGVLPSGQSLISPVNALITKRGIQYDIDSLDRMLRGFIPIPRNRQWIDMYDQMEINEREIIKSSYASESEYLRDTKLWVRMREMLQLVHLGDFGFTVYPVDLEDDQEEGNWRSFDSRLYAYPEVYLSEAQARLTLIHRTSLRLVAKHHWQFAADRFVLKSLSLFEREVLSTWSRISTLFRPGFAPNTSRMNHRREQSDSSSGSGHDETTRSIDESLMRMMGSRNVQPRAYECIDAIFKRSDITRVTAREGLWVYRGMALGADATFTLDSGQYVSVSYDQSVCEYFKYGHGIIVHIWLPPGTPFILLDAFNENERELVLPRNHRLRVLTQSTTRRLSVTRQKNEAVAARFAFEWDPTFDKDDNKYIRANQSTVPREQIIHLQKQLERVEHGQNSTKSYARVLQTLRWIQMIARGQDLVSMNRQQQIEDLLSLLPKSVNVNSYNKLQKMMQYAPESIFLSWLNSNADFNPMSNCLLLPETLDGFLAGWMNKELRTEELNRFPSLAKFCADFFNEQRNTPFTEVNVPRLVEDLKQMLALRGFVSDVVET